jgi:hypothetical protein
LLVLIGVYLRLSAAIDFVFQHPAKARARGACGIMKVPEDHG